MRPLSQTPENLVPISITNLTVSMKAPNGSTIGTLALMDDTAKNQIANFMLTPDSAGFFGISGNNLVTVRGRDSARQLFHTSLGER
jgi:hypothetical protein